eukprot:5003630-Amphidinium_carterae.1
MTVIQLNSYGEFDEAKDHAAVKSLQTQTSINQSSNKQVHNKRWVAFGTMRGGGCLAAEELLWAEGMADSSETFSGAALLVVVRSMTLSNTRVGFNRANQ